MIFDDTKCQLGEGPLWHPLRQQLFWFDILNYRLLTKGKTWQFDTYVSAAGWVDEDRLLIASSKALEVFDLRDGTQSRVTALEADNPVTRSNDGRADPYGGFWIGTMGINAEPKAGAIWRYYRGELRKIFDDITISNAICFHPDGQTACFTDTPTQLVLRVKLDQDGWPVGDPWVHVDLRGTDKNPDGAVFDATGNIWIANWGSSRVTGYDATGQEFAAFETTAPQITCPAFGGPALKTLYATTAAIDRADGDDDGKVFAFETDHTGQQEHRVIL